MATETIKVTTEDIREACFRRDADDYDSFRECPIGQATERQHPNWDFRVFRSNITAFEGNTSREIALPREATWFIEEFDNGMPVEPFEFTIEV